MPYMVTKVIFLKIKLSNWPFQNMQALILKFPLSQTRIKKNVMRRKVAHEDIRHTFARSDVVTKVSYVKHCKEFLKIRPKLKTLQYKNAYLRVNLILRN